MQGESRTPSGCTGCVEQGVGQRTRSAIHHSHRHGNSPQPNRSKRRIGTYKAANNARARNTSPRDTVSQDTWCRWRCTIDLRDHCLDGIRATTILADPGIPGHLHPVSYSHLYSYTHTHTHAGFHEYAYAEQYANHDSYIDAHTYADAPTTNGYTRYRAATGTGACLASEWCDFATG